MKLIAIYTKDDGWSLFLDDQPLPKWPKQWSSRVREAFMRFMSIPQPPDYENNEVVDISKWLEDSSEKL